ncbi:MAG: S1 RNA-binding domain-containing protein [Bacteroidales bacterium]|nr:S1 RNA-binding domain-containing protein [Fournierella massiliensis]MCF2557105.1 30S ribosomal protein S1 [Fournierella massiliensis]MCI6740815.1 S1 RNA-binding domain-containing protein [Bacteroidales bacterium]
MLEFQAEGLCKSADRLDEAALRRAMAGQEILQSTALAFDTQRRLHFTLGGLPALMEYEECAEGVAQGTVRDIAILTRVGRPTCFLIQSCEATESGQLVFHLSRTEAQRRCRREYLDELPLGSVIHCTVTHIEPFGAFCDVGCGISALLPIDCLSVSRISSPADRVSVGQQLLCAVKSRDPQGRLVLTLRELLGTWSENAACFSPGETVVGIVRSVEDYGVFIEIAPNLAGLAESGEGLRPGQTVSVYIKNILPDKMKIKLVVVNRNVGSPLRFEPRYFIRSGRLQHWVYSTPQSPKQIETTFV